MIALFHGAVGALMVLALLTLGAYAGWTVRGKLGKTAAAEENQEEQRRAREEQRAFEDMLHYNMDTAYGMNGGLAELMGGEED